MILNYAALDGLQRELLATSDSDIRSDDELLKHTTLGARGLLDPIIAQLVAKIASRLYHSPLNELVRQLCRGAIIEALQGHEQTRDRLPYALQLVQRASYASPSPVSVQLPSETTARARDQLARYSGSPGHLDKLVSTVEDFVRQNDALAGRLLFARFIADLEYLRDVILDETRSGEDCTIAAGALTYFAEIHDAIDDDLGVVGVLDDAYIVQLACDSIDPTRRIKTAIVDSVLAQWPFLSTLCLELNNEEWCPTEFVLLNLAATFGPTTSPLNSLILPTLGELPLWLGVLASLGVLHDSLDRKLTPFRPQIGDFVSIAGHLGEVAEIVGYHYPLHGRSTDIAQPEDARFVALKYIPRTLKSRAPPVKHIRPVDFLDACVRANEPERTRRMSLPPNRNSVPLGPLERLFGLSHPARFTEIKRRVIVVSALGHAQEFLSKTSVLGSPLADIIPIAKTNPDADYAMEWLSTCRYTDVPVLTIARDVPEAAAIIGRRSDDDISVIFPVDQEAWPAACVKEFTEVRAIAVIRQRDAELASTLKKFGFSFLDWTPELESCVARGPRKSEPNAIELYELGVRKQLHAKVQIYDAELDSVETGLGALKEFSHALRDEYGEDTPTQIATWAIASQRLYFNLVGLPVPFDRDAAARTKDVIQKLKSDMARMGRFWPERSSTAAVVHITEIQRIADDLERDNPKATFVADLLSREVAICCSQVRWSEISRLFPSSIRLINRTNPSVSPVLLFEWPGTSRMTRMLLPPIGDPTHVVFYKWERDSLLRIQCDRNFQIEQHWDKSTRPPSWHLDDIPITRRTTGNLVPIPPSFILEDWEVSLRRQSVVAHSIATDNRDLIVAAMPVYFVGSLYALYTPDYEVLVVTNLAYGARAGDARLHQRLASALEIDDVVVVVKGSKRDAIRDHADARLPSGARDLARTWQGALLALRSRLSSDRAVCDAVREAGCEKTDTTVLAWLHSTTQIGPHDDSDIDAIVKASCDRTLSDKLAECKRAIHSVRSEHLRASHVLATNALRELSSRLGRGEAIDSAIDLGNQLQLLTVESLDPRQIRVSESATNIVRDLP